MEMFSASQLYACNSSESDEVLSLLRLVRFELVMTQNFKLRRASTGAFFHGQPKTCVPITVALVKASVTQTAIRVVTSAKRSVVSLGRACCFTRRSGQKVVL
jgi:hypothetical protein